jgi:hypothetical protein
VLPEWFEFYVGLEAEAATLRTYEAEAVPGLLQTEAYAREVYRLTAGEEGLDRKVAARLRRQDVLRGDDPVDLSVVLNEAALLRPVSERTVMAEQMTHLETVAQLPNVTIQVLPFSAGGHPAMNSPYVLLTFADAADAAVVYLENLSTGLALEEAAQVRSYSLVHERLRRLALDPAASLVRLKEASRYFT